MFYKDRSSEKFREVYKKTPVLEFLCNKVAGLESAKEKKRDFSASVYL